VSDRAPVTPEHTSSTSNRPAESPASPLPVSGRRSLLRRLFPHHEKRVLKKLVRSWFIQGIGWYALIEVTARVILEGGFLLVFWFAGFPLLTIAIAWLAFHTLVWVVLYGGFMRTWIVLGFSKELPQLQAHYERLAARAKRQRLFRLVFVRGSTARGEMNVRSDIDIMLIPKPGLRSEILGVLFVWGLRVESLLRRIPVEARWIDAERYAPWHHIEETPLILHRDPDAYGTPQQRLASRGYLVSLSGLDGAGKTTVARRVVARLNEQGVHAVYMWGHRQPWFRGKNGPELSLGIVFESLWKRLGRRTADLERHPAAKSTYDLCTSLDYFYVRWRLSSLLRPSTIVVADRYAPDVISYLRSWGPLKVSLEGLLVGIAYPADLAILLDLSPEQALQRKRENSPRQLERFARAYNELRRFFSFVPVDATGSVDQVSSRVEQVLKERLGIRAATPKMS